MLTRTLVNFVPIEDHRSYQFSAIQGDLQHKLFVYQTIQDFGYVAERFFSNYHQANYVRDFAPELVPPPVSGNPPSDHTLGTVFEHHWNLADSFQARYALRLRDFIHKGVDIGFKFLPDPPTPVSSPAPNSLAASVDDDFVVF